MRVRIGEAVVVVQRGASLLDAVEAADVPTASSCGGSGRCGLCWVRVLEGGEFLSRIDEHERAMIAVANTPDVARTRLACRALVTIDDGDIVVDVPPIDTVLA